MNIKYLIDYVEICNVLSIEPTIEGLGKYKSYRTSKENALKNRWC